MRISASIPADIAERMNDRPADEPAEQTTDIALMVALTDPEIIWEGLGPDGVQYPFNDTVPLGASAEQRRELARRRSEYDDIVAINIGDLIRTKDYLELGHRLAKQVENHARRVTEARQ